MKTRMQTRLGVPGAWLLLASLVGCSGGEDAGSATPPADPGASTGSAGSAATPDEPSDEKVEHVGGTSEDELSAS